MPNDEQLRLLLLNIDVNKESITKEEKKEKIKKVWIKQKEDAKKPSTTDDSKASDKCESPPIVPGKTDTQMADNITSDSESTSTNNDKFESPLIVPGNIDTEMVGNTFTESFTISINSINKKIHQTLERMCEQWGN